MSKLIDFNSNFIDFNDEFEKKALLSLSSVCLSFPAEPKTMSETLKKIHYAKEKNLTLGVCLGFLDFDKNISEEELEALVLFQIGVIASLSQSDSAKIEFVRLNEEMVDFCLENEDKAKIIASAIKKYSEWLILYAPISKLFIDLKGEGLADIALELDLSYAYDNDFKFLRNQEKDSIKEIDKLKKYIETGEIDGLDSSLLKIESIFLKEKGKQFCELAQKASLIVKPSPVSYNRAEASGWV